jgi:hypothetical protein
MVPRTGLDYMEKRKFLPYRDSNSNPSEIQPVASHYTDIMCMVCVCVCVCVCGVFCINNYTNSEPGSFSETSRFHSVLKRMTF